MVSLLLWLAALTAVANADLQTLIVQGPAVSYEVTSTVVNSPLLVSLPVDDDSPTDEAIAAFRYSELKLPKSAIIAEALLTVTSVSSTTSKGDVRIRIGIAKPGDSATVLTTANNDLSTRAYLDNGSIFWAPPDFPDSESLAYTLPGMRDQFRALLQHANWSGGDPFVLLMSLPEDDSTIGGSNFRSLYTGRGGTTGPVLTISYTTVVSSHSQLGNFETLCSRLAGTSGLAFFGTWIIATVICIAVAAMTYFRGDNYGGRATAVGLRAVSSKSAAKLNPSLFGQMKRQQTKMRDFFDWELASKQVVLGPEIGRGRYGYIYQAMGLHIREFDRVEVAVRMCDLPEGRRERGDFIDTARLMMLYAVPHHINVVRFLGIVSQSTPVLAVTELCSHGSLQSVLRGARPDHDGGEARLSMVECLKMAADVARGMAYLSNQGFVHRDLCARNCLVHDNLTVKISGFDSSLILEGSPLVVKNGHMTMNVRWMSPQVISDGDYTTTSDVWSYGVLLFECVTFAAKPYPELSNQQVCEEVMRGHTMSLPPSCPHAIYRIMRRCWHIGAHSRPDFEDLLGSTSDELRRAKEGRLGEYSNAGSSSSLVSSRRPSVHDRNRRPSGLGPSRRGTDHGQIPFNAVQPGAKRVPRPSQIMRDNPNARISPNMMQAQLLHGSRMDIRGVPKPPPRTSFGSRSDGASAHNQEPVPAAPMLPNELLTRNERPTRASDVASAPRMAGLRKNMGKNTLNRSIKAGVHGLKRVGLDNEPADTSTSMSVPVRVSAPSTGRPSIPDLVPAVLTGGTSAFENVDRANPLFGGGNSDDELEGNAPVWKSGSTPKEPLYYLDPETNELLPARSFEMDAAYDLYIKQHESEASPGDHLTDPDEPGMVYVRVN
eukprot:m.75374 g.75374  ORF g.75374 m.75374 type:complete len:885 (+) comp14402_c0_seq1:85-2739(+)